MALYPLPGYALVKLAASKYKHIAAQQKVYEAASSGVLLKCNYPSDTLTAPSPKVSYEQAVGQIVYWEELNAKAPIEYDGVQFAYVKLEDLMGYEYAESN